MYVKKSLLHYLNKAWIASKTKKEDYEQASDLRLLP